MRHLLIITCKNKNEDIIKLLIKYGADVNQDNWCNETPLIIVCKYEQENRVKILIENGANVNTKISENIPLIIACKSGNEDMVKLFN